MSKKGISRRRLLRNGLLVAAAGGLGWRYRVDRTVLHWLDRERSPVSLVACPDYGTGLAAAVATCLERAELTETVRGRRVVLKPNFVDRFPDRPVNTDPRVLLEAARLFRKSGAREVIIAEGPGNRSQCRPMLSSTGLLDLLRAESLPFVDLNHDELVPVTTRVVAEMDTPSLIPRLFVPKTIAEADLVVSMPKLKCHHHVGVTLAMKNFFGCVPGVRYGWPKNILHWNGIERSIVELVSTFAAQTELAALVDGVIGMEGDGPLAGQARPAGVLLAGRDLVAVDATATRLMGMDPERIGYLRSAEVLGLGRLAERRIELHGAEVADLRQPFAPAPGHEHLATT